MVTIEEARRRYRYWHRLAEHGRSLEHGDRARCFICNRRWLEVEAASVLYDNAIALQYAGPRPRLAARALGVAWA